MPTARRSPMPPTAAALAAVLLAVAPPADAGEIECEATGGLIELLSGLDVEPGEVLADPSDLLAEVRKLRRRLERRFASRCVRLNQIQVLGTHNSYHIEPTPEALELLQEVDPEFDSLEYSHPRLKRQFRDQGIRQIELDIFADPQGGLYAQPRGPELVTGEPAEPNPKLQEPGFKVLHVQDVDYDTTCLTLVACLRQVKRWSDRNPGHLPMFILIEAKQDVIPFSELFGFVEPIPFDAPLFRALDQEILEVFPRERILTPDDVRGARDTLEEAVLEDGWPLLGDVRGRVVFLLDNGGGTGALYRDGADSLEDRILFTNASPGQPDAAFVKANDPVSDPDLIPDLVRTGYLVRTRADADTREARSGDTTRRDIALGSGAHFISTDYPEPDPDFGTGYQVEIPGGRVGRCNPVNGPEGCRDKRLEKRPENP